MSAGYAVVTGANVAISRQPPISPQQQYTGGMWRIPVFLVITMAAFFGVTFAVATLADAGVVWLAIVTLALGMGAFAVTIFPLISWVIEGRWGGFYRR